MRIISVLFCVAAAAAAQEPGITREQADAILNELRQIRLLLQRAVQPAAAQPPEAPRKVTVKLGPGESLGRKDAPLTMVEYTDYQCGFCRSFHLNTFPEIKKRYIDTGKLRFFSRDLPLDFHSNAFRAAEAARCAADQGKFWEMRDVLVTNANRLNADDLNGYAGQLKLNLQAFRTCMDGGKHKAAIQRDLEEAARLNIGGTPTFVVGRTTSQGLEGEMLVGAHPFPAFEAKLKELEGR